MRRRGILIGLSVVSVLITAGCSAPTSPIDSHSSTARPSSTSSVKQRTTPIILTCNDSQGTSQYGTPTLGVASEMWGDNGPGENINLDSLKNYSSNGHTLVKSPLTVLSEAKPGTKLEVVSPSSAALFYTSWSSWGKKDTATMLSSASKAVVVSGCEQASQFPGGIIVTGPTCVKLRILSGSDASQKATVSVPIGKRCGV